MHATQIGRFSQFPYSATFGVALALAFGPAPAFTQDALPAPVTSAPQAPVPVVAPKPPVETLDASLVFRQPDAPAPKPSLAGPASSAIEVSRAVPFVSRLTDLNLLSGLYEFDDDPNGNLAGVHPGVDLAHTNRISLDESFSQNPDLNRRNSFIGLWASIPLRDLGPNRSQATTPLPGSSPSRTLIASIGGEPTRHRTSRKAESAGHNGFFSRFRPGSGFLSGSPERTKSEPTPALPAPEPVQVPVEPQAPSGSEAPSPQVGEKAAEKPSRGLAADFINRIRK